MCDYLFFVIRSLSFSKLSLFQFMLKFVAFGLGYFQSLRNVFDCLLSILALVYITLAVVYLSGSNIVSLKLYTMLIYCCRS